MTKTDANTLAEISPIMIELNSFLQFNLQLCTFPFPFSNSFGYTCVFDSFKALWNHPLCLRKMARTNLQVLDTAALENGWEDQKSARSRVKSASVSTR
jgi:hypothetical protein